MSDGDSRTTMQTDASIDARVPVTTVVHPFFMPPSTKRAINATHTCSGDNDTQSDDTTAETEAQRRKRQKQKVAAGQSVGGEKRGRKPKIAPQSTKIHSFFAVSTKRLNDQVPVLLELNDDGVDDGASNDDDNDEHEESPSDNVDITAAVDGRMSVSRNTVSKEDSFVSVFSASTKPEIRAQKAQRPIFRPIGIPAPYPSEYTHIPLPAQVPFEPVARAQNSRFSVDAIDIAAAQRSLANLTCSKHQDNIDSGCMQWQQELSSRISTQFQTYLSSRSTADRAIRAASVKFTRGAANLPRVPPHFQFAVPFLSALCGQAEPLDASNLNTQLLSSRYRPKRACEVLDNRRVVLQLHSWIEGMRLKRALPVPERAAPTEKMIFFDRSSAKTLRVSRRTIESDEDDSEANAEYTYFMGGGKDDADSSDDFMPRKPLRRKKKIKSKDELEDVIAWAQSDGTLNTMRDKKSRRLMKHQRQGSNGTSSDTESFANVILLEGPSGSGKTAAVYACAEESGFEVCEIHPGQRRSGKDVLAILEDVILSHTIAAPTSNSDGKAATRVNQMLILIEQIDVLFEQDLRLWPALKQLALKSRRPIVLTCTEAACVRWETLIFHSVLRFSRPSESLLVPYCFMLCLAEGALVSPADLAHMCRDAGCDLNRILCALEVVVRRANLPQSLTCDDTSLSSTGINLDLDLGGTLTWLFNPLEPGETPDTRYRFWMELVTSAQPADCIRNWFHLWPDPPPTFDAPPPVAQSTETTLLAPAMQNMLFSQHARTVEPIASANRPSLGVSVPPVLALPSLASQSQHGNGAPDAGRSPGHSHLAQSDLDQLNAVAESLDTLSLARAVTSESPTQHECLREPMYSFVAPMTDNCLDVNYLLLDFDVLTRYNDTVLPDSFDSASQQTCAEIDRYLRDSATNRLVTVRADGCSGSIELMMAAQGVKQPDVPPADISVQDAVQSGLFGALEFSGLQPQRCGHSRVAEAAGYLSTIVTWDWVHQGKAEPPALDKAAASTLLAEQEQEQHLYRVGIRRTRMNTYRAHIKRMSTEMQKFVTSWGKYI
ncbi:hypothetical protein BX661DRAFT_184215 [Kickxella alabastrina]|uniref:uncharacterized protein n=1 Tax=Kickxella alabastrina TaxID=61397 RepID=UPI00222085AA|nr:uncharacterized protein BX661DRAFT_184215 [Kickxella alabastrina]KAI7825811.1 hypothetical protein BX661DRAFT_184215 [Kickxella alabastrina]